MEEQRGEHVIRDSEVFDKGISISVDTEDAQGPEMEGPQIHPPADTLETVARDMATLLRQLRDRLDDGKFRVKLSDAERIAKLLQRYRAVS